MKRKPIIIALLVLLVLFAGVLIYTRLHKPSTKTASTDVVTNSLDEPSQKKPEEEGYKWKGGPTDPKQIVINSIGVKAYVQKVGVDQNKRIAVPTNVHLTGWFTDSQKPGDNGLSIIDGHIVDQSDLGIFTRLNSLKKGDTYDIIFGNDSVKHFEVMDTLTVDVAKAEASLFSQDPTVRQQLNLITCGGTYDEAPRTFDKRIIVTSKLTS